METCLCLKDDLLHVNMRFTLLPIRRTFRACDSRKTSVPYCTFCTFHLLKLEITSCHWTCAPSGCINSPQCCSLPVSPHVYPGTGTIDMSH